MKKHFISLFCIIFISQWTNGDAGKIKTIRNAEFDTATATAALNCIFEHLEDRNVNIFKFLPLQKEIDEQRLITGKYAKGMLFEDILKRFSRQSNHQYKIIDNIIFFGDKLPKKLPAIKPSNPLSAYKDIILKNIIIPVRKEHKIKSHIPADQIEAANGDQVILKMLEKEYETEIVLHKYYFIPIEALVKKNDPQKRNIKIKVSKKVDLNSLPEIIIGSISLDQLVNAICTSANLTYSVNGNQIFIDVNRKKKTTDQLGNN